MKTDNIKEIKIDDRDRLCIFPENERFTGIWRTATEVHWDNAEGYLYSPPPKEHWEHSFIKWYQQILNVVKLECGVDLILSPTTIWSNVPADIRDKFESL